MNNQLVTQEMIRLLQDEINELRLALAEARATIIELRKEKENVSDET